MPPEKPKKIRKADEVIDSPAEHAGKPELLASFGEELDQVSDSLGLTEDIDASREKAAASKTFDLVDRVFAKVSIFFPKKEYLDRYLAYPEEARVPLKVIERYFRKLSRRIKGSNTLRAALHAKQDDVVYALSLFCMGQSEGAKSVITGVLGHLSSLRTVEKFKKALRINRLTDEGVNALMGVFRANGISPEEALAYVGKIKAMPAFKKLKYGGDDIARILGECVTILHRGAEKGPSFVDLILNVESVFSVRRANLEAKTGKATGDARAQAEALERYRGRLGGIPMDYGIANYERDIATRNRDVAIGQMRLELNKACYELAMTYLSSADVDPSAEATVLAVQEIMNSRSSGDLETVVGKYGLKETPYITTVKVAEAAVEMAANERDAKRKLAENPGDVDLYAEFLRSGEVSPEAEKMLTKRFNKELAVLVNADAALSDQIGTEAEFFESYADSNLADVPLEDRQYVASRVQAYLLLLHKHSAVKGRMIGLASSMELLHSHGNRYPYIDPERGKFVLGGKRDKAPKGLEFPKDWVKDFVRPDAEDARSQIVELEVFLGVEEEHARLIAPDIDQLSVSPLHETLLASETGQYDREFASHMGKITEGQLASADFASRMRHFQQPPASAPATATVITAPIAISFNGSEE